jgi:hypothetical protein
VGQPDPAGRRMPTSRRRTARATENSAAGWRCRGYHRRISAGLQDPAGRVLVT